MPLEKSSELEQVLHDYVQYLHKALLSAQRETESNRRLAVLQTKEQFLRNTVEACETTPAFDRLAKATEQKSAVECFFRLSGTYQDLLDEAHPHYDEIYKQFHAAFTKTKQTITHLAPLEFVRFSNDVMDFGTFRIQRFKETELDKILNHRAKRVFYPEACVPTKEIVDYWFLCTEEIDTRDPDHGIAFDPAIRPKYSSHPQPVEQALRCLSLYDLGPQESRVREFTRRYNAGLRWYSLGGRPPRLTPRVPFVIRVSDSLIADPSRGPDTTILEKEPREDLETARTRESVRP